MNNKILFFIVVLLFPIVVISFILKKDETNFILEKNFDEEITIKILVDGVVQTLSIDDYIIGVVAGEMPASFETEALKAQAVASRTYALYHQKKNESNLYDLTDDISSQVYLTSNEMIAKWGNDYSKYYNKIKNAVADTKDEVIVYDGELIESLYFSMSSGNTQEAKFVFAEDRDYLKSVESPYDNSSLKNYEVETIYKKEDFLKLLNISCKEILIDNITRNDSGYVMNLDVCNTHINGNDFRYKLKLRSANFTIKIADNIIVTTKGYGHGVGMSQYGANGYAQAGYTYKDIIKHYYSEVDIISFSDV